MSIPKSESYSESTQRKQAAVVIVAMLLIFIVFGSALFYSSWRNVEAVKESLIDERLTLLHEASLDYFNNPTQSSEAELAELLSAQSGEACTTLYDINGETVSKVTYDGYEPAASDTVVDLDIVDQAGEKHGSLRYIFTPVSSYAWMYHSAIIFGLAVIFAALLAPMIIKLISRLSVQPINRISSLAESIANSNDYRKRLAVTNQDAVGRLSENINQMLEAIEGREAQLTNYGKYLEELLSEKSKQLQAQSSEDAMTLCPNRMSLMRDGDEIIRRAAEQGNIAGIVVIDLLRIKSYNQSYGHHIGDSIIRTVAHRLRQNYEYVYRIGGDEFCIIIQHPHLSSIEEMAHQVLSVADEPIHIEDQEINISIAAGVAISPDHGDTINVLLRAANLAMNYSKSEAGTIITEYDDAHFIDINRLIQLEKDLADAIEQDEIYLVYQPKTHLKTLRIDSVEALARWHHPRLGAISPIEFVGIAEKAGLARQLGNAVLRQAVVQLAKWRDLGLPLSIAVNISPDQIMHPDFVQDIKRALALEDIDPVMLELEITESIMMSPHVRVDDSIEEIRALGIRVAIDDFGTGYSSLSYIRKFAIDSLKIDQSFISDIHTSPESSGVVNAIMMLAHTLELDVVAEGVELDEQLVVLNTLGCDYVQGNYLSPPITAEQVEHHALTKNLEVAKSGD